MEFETNIVNRIISLHHLTHHFVDYPSFVSSIRIEIRSLTLYIDFQLFLKVSTQVLMSYIGFSRKFLNALIG